MNVDWKSLRAVVLESDDWGFCGWCADDAAACELADTPAFQAAGPREGRSTLENAGDVRALAALLAEARGADGFPAVLQANTTVANPDFDALDPSAPQGELPLVTGPEFPARWARPGLCEEVGRAIEAGTWWPELQGLHRLPESAWRASLARGDADARRALAQGSPLCTAVRASAEYDPFEPPDLRERDLTRAVRAFEESFGRPPGSLAPPDARWDDFLEAQSEAVGIAILQRKSEQHDVFAGGLRRLWQRARWPRFRNRQLYMPARISFEPGANDAGAGVEAGHRAARAAWGRGQPAVVGTRRVNYAHLDADVSRAGRTALGDLLRRLAADGAVFLTDSEVSQIVGHGASVRPLGATRVRLRSVHGGTLTWTASADVTGARFLGEAKDAEITVEGGRAEARLPAGAFEVEWRRAGVRAGKG